MSSQRLLLVSFLVLVGVLGVHSFAPVSPRITTTTTTQMNGIFDKVEEFFQELDAFVDDATSRRLGNGSKFYGKRRSKFYGTDDKDRKRDNAVADPTEDYQGPTSSGFFKWMPDENGQMRPVTRMKEKTLDKPGMWDKIYSADNEDK